MSGTWQTMESAPKDGTRILACCWRNARWYYAVTWWRLPEDRAGYVGWGEFNTPHWPPVYWQPIEPPKRRLA